jgi:hypothetical protein
MRGGEFPALIQTAVFSLSMRVCIQRKGAEDTIAASRGLVE